MANGNQSNNQRSNSMNPNNAAYKESSNNRSNQNNPNNSSYKAKVDNRANQKIQIILKPKGDR